MNVVFNVIKLTNKTVYTVTKGKGDSAGRTCQKINNHTKMREIAFVFPVLVC